MSRLRAWARGFFGFSRTETNAFVILLPLMMALIFSEPAYRYWFTRQPQNFSKEKKELDSIMTTWKWEKDSAIVKSLRINPFSFNPNQVTKDELVALGFENPLGDRIINFRLKGGRFRVKRDLMKIYGMDSNHYKKIEQYINLPAKFERSATNKPEQKSKPVSLKFDLNKADSLQLMKIYGVGQKLSHRIISYRDKLGGFISISQIKEVYGLDSAVVEELASKSYVEENFQPRQININRVAEKELGTHPYVRYKLAKAIIAYRFQHGMYGSLEELKKIELIDEIKFAKIKPYLSANP
jgi:DNA uptake protein ComE-like DNA-binding protein